jgi:hypothetical protein
MTLKVTPSYLEVGQPDRIIKETKLSEWMRVLDTPDHVRSGFDVSDTGGITVSVGIGDAMIYGYLIENDQLISPINLVDNTINYIYIVLTFDANSRILTAAIETNLTGVTPIYGIKLATVTTAGTDITLLESNIQYGFLHATGGHKHRGTSGDGPLLDITSLPCDVNNGLPILNNEGNLLIKGSKIYLRFIDSAASIYDRISGEQAFYWFRDSQNHYRAMINEGDIEGEPHWYQMLTTRTLGMQGGPAKLNLDGSLDVPFGNINVTPVSNQFWFTDSITGESFLYFRKYTYYDHVGWAGYIKVGDSWLRLLTQDVWPWTERWPLQWEFELWREAWPWPARWPLWTEWEAWREGWPFFPWWLPPQAPPP